jgi:hypothetical protein
MLADGSNFLAVNTGWQTAGVLPPELGRIYNHECAVIRVPCIFIGTVRAPEGFDYVFTTVDPDPVLLLTLVKLIFFFNFGAVPGTLFIYFEIFLTIHTLFFLGMFSCWVFFPPELGMTPASGQIIFFLLGRGWGAGRDSNPGLPYSSPAR